MQFCIKNGTLLRLAVLLGTYVSLADQKGIQRGRLNWHLKRIFGEVIRRLLKYCIYCASAPSLHGESITTRSLRIVTLTICLLCLLQMSEPI